MNWYKQAQSKIKFVLIHGWEGGPDKDWFPWLNSFLSKKGYKVVNLSMPNPFNPEKKMWVKHILDHINSDKNTIFIAHSLGCIALLKYIEQIKNKIKGIIMVAPYIENDKKYKTISSFFYGKLNYKKIKNNCPKIYSIFSDNDPYISLRQYYILEKELKAKCFILHDRGHFTSDKIPEIIDILKKDFNI